MSTDKEVSALFQTAIDQHQSGNFSEAVTLYKKILTLSPKQADTLHLLGVALHQLDDSKKAVEYIQQAIQLNPERNAYYSNLGAVYSDLEQYDKAIVALEHALSLEPNQPKSLYNIAVSYEQKGDIDKAITYLQQIFVTEPNNVDGLMRIGTILQKLNREEEAIGYYTRLLKIVPDFYLTYNNMGILCTQIGEYEKALAYLQKANALKPDDGEILCNLGIAYQKIERFDEAIATLEYSIELLPDFPGSHNNLGNVYLNILDYDNAAIQYHKTLEIDPEYPVEHNIGILHQRKCEYKEAVKWYNKALEKNPKSYTSQYNIAMIDLVHGFTPKKFAAYESRFLTPDCPPRPYTYPHWKGESLAGKTILLTGDQGIGDELMFSSMIPEIIDQADRVILETNYRLVPLFKRSFPKLAALYPTAKPAYPALLKEKGIDVQCPMGSLPQYLREQESDYPDHSGYVIPDPKQVKALRTKYIAGKKKLLVGISWHTKNSWTGMTRRIALLKLVPLLEVANIQFVDLQYGDHREELAAFKKETGHNIIHDNSIDSLQDLDGFASQTAAMDLVISIDNATVHMAGALGVPVWTLLPYSPEWRWMLDREDTPWYPSMKLFRQSVLNSWDEVIKQVVLELHSWQEPQ